LPKKVSGKENETIAELGNRDEKKVAHPREAGLKGGKATVSNPGGG